MMTEAQKIRQLLLEYLAESPSIPLAEIKLEKEIDMMGYDCSQVIAELQTLESLGYIFRLSSVFGTRWLILDKGKEALRDA